MSGKIKEILEALKSHNDIIKEYPLTLSIEEQKLLLDYITNLQEENQKLNKIIDELEKTVEDFITNHTEQYLDWKYDEKIYNAETNVLSKLHDKIFDKLTELKKEVE